MMEVEENYVHHGWETDYFQSHFIYENGWLLWINADFYYNLFLETWLPIFLIDSMLTVLVCANKNGTCR